jgi:hypothetical protein
MFPQSSGYRDTPKALESFFTDAGIDVGLFNERPDSSFVIHNNPEYFGDPTVTTGSEVEQPKEGLNLRDLNPTPKPETKKQEDDKKKERQGDLFL